MVKWQPFASMPEQFTCIKEMIQEQTTVPRPILTQDEKERIENKLLISYLGEEEVLLTYYKNGYLYKNYITVAEINPLNKTIICTDAFHNQRMFKFGDVMEVN
ncbi:MULTISPECIES: YolD-like family protein [Bacillus cereus group]|nr:MULTISPECIES: YolD-like family protein [Bacillus cereus group]MCC2374216.1 YolD-like family protein [Bacillus paranthracis]MDA1956653.1 YolD-like family protein [Bacillus cereus group sp. BcHK114]